MISTEPTDSRNPSVCAGCHALSQAQGRILRLVLFVVLFLSTAVIDRSCHCIIFWLTLSLSLYLYLSLPPFLSFSYMYLLLSLCKLIFLFKLSHCLLVDIFCISALRVCLCVYDAVCPHVSQSIILSVCLSVCLSICLSLSLSLSCLYRNQSNSKLRFLFLWVLHFF